MTFDALRDMMADIFDVDPAKITMDSTPDDIEAWDSVRLLDLLLEIEQQSGVAISPERIQDMMSVRAILGVIDAERAAA